MEERAKTERKILLSKIGLTASLGFLTAYGASYTDIGFGGGGADHHATVAAHEVPGAHEMQPSHTPYESLPASKDLMVEVHPGDNLWKILRHKLEEQGALKDLSTADQNRMIAMLEREADTPEMMKAIGIREDIDLIYPDQHLNLAPLLEHSKVPGVAEYFPAHHTGGVHEALNDEAVPPKVEAGPEADLHETGPAEPVAAGVEHHPVPEHGPEAGHHNGPIGAEDSYDAHIPDDPMTRLWRMQHPGENPPASFLRQAGEMRAHGMRLENTEMFKSEVEFRIKDSLREIFGPRGINSREWDYWKRYSADEIMRMPDNYIGGPTAAHLRAYLRDLASSPNLEGPYTPGWRHETVEDFIARAEKHYLSEELKFGGQ